MKFRIDFVVLCLAMVVVLGTVVYAARIEKVVEYHYVQALRREPQVVEASRLARPDARRIASAGRPFMR